MKLTITLLSLFVTLNVFGQADFTKYDDLVRDIAHFGSVQSNFIKEHTRSAGMELTHKLDSIVSKNGLSITTDIIAMEYNTNGTTKTMKQYSLDSATATLQLEGTFYFNYSGLEVPSNVVIEGLNPETQEFETQIEIDLFYDGAERIDSSVISLEDPFSGGFGPLLATKQVYSGDLLVQTRQWLYISLFGSWTPASFTDFMYNGQDLLIDQQTSVIDFLTAEVSPDSRTTYSYNAQSLQDTVTQFIWMDPSWLGSQRFIYDYHGNETLANEVTQLFNGSAFVNESWTTYPIENVVDELPYTYFMWNNDESNWVKMDSTIELLNPALQWDQVAAPTELSVLSVLGDGGIGFPFLTSGSTIDESKYFVVDTNTQNFFSAGNDIYYYSMIEGSAVIDVLPAFLSVVPNPAQDQFAIAIEQNINAEYVVYASNGVEKVRGVANPGTNYIRTSSWPQGMYYVMITFDDGSTYAHKQLIH